MTLEARIAVATLAGEHLGNDPRLGLLRMAFEGYAALRQAVREASPDFFWPLQDAPPEARLTPGLELTRFWDTPKYVLARRSADTVASEGRALLTVAQATLAWRAQGLSAPARVENALHRIETVTRYCRAALHRRCRRCGAESRWLELPVQGLQDDGDGGHLELRNCPCGTTFALSKEQIL